MITKSQGTDAGGITTAGGAVEADSDSALPDKVSAEDARKFTSLLKKFVKDDPDAYDTATVRELVARAKTHKDKAVQWRGGGGFTAAVLGPQVFDYDPDLHLIVLTEAATGQTLVRSVAANLGFWLTESDPVFHARKNAMRLVVHEGTLTIDHALDLASHLDEGEGLTIAATGRDIDVQAKLRRLDRRVRVIHVPDDLFSPIEDDAVGLDDKEILA